jgi:acylphosphatase
MRTLVVRNLSATAPSQHFANLDDGQTVVLRMKVRGQLRQSYLGFVAERARWLSLSGWAESTEQGQAEIVAAGPDALVGALEMACVLGPLDAIVDTLVCEEESQPVPAGFVIR